MCVWCAYAGDQQAAPLLWESLRKIEGLWGGYYTGLVTMDENGLHWEKCVGCTEVWQKQFQLKDFPGCAGLAHSRTPSGGDEHRAHPFVGTSPNWSATHHRGKSTRFTWYTFLHPLCF